MTASSIWCKLAVLVAGAGVLALPGCPEPLPKTRVALGQLVREHNANARRVPRLWARAKIKFTMADPDGGLPTTWGSVSPLAMPNGLVLLAKGDRSGPDDFALIGRETAAMELFRVGISRDEGAYYFWYSLGDEAAAYWGHTDLAGAPGLRMLAMNPQDLLTALGVSDLPADPTDLPAVVLQMDRTPGHYAYVLQHIDRQPVTGQILLRREIHVRWSDTQARRPFLMRFFDADGECVMTADLADYQTFPSADDDEPPVVMPTNIRITWPISGAGIHLALSEMTVDDKWDRAACRFRDHLPPSMTDDRIIQVDRHLIPEETDEQ